MKIKISILLIGIFSVMVPLQAIPPPAFVKGIYVTITTSQNSKRMNSLISLIENTELNSVVLDIEEDGAVIWAYNQNVRELIQQLHRKNIYVIGRIIVFKNSGYARKNPIVALKNRQGGPWRDSVGASWIDPAAKSYWDYIIDLSKQAIEIGFDEINLDYIRFPSDGAVGQIIYPYFQGSTRWSVLREFFQTLRSAVDIYNQQKKINIPISIDIFGIVCFQKGDGGIGQRLQDIVEFFDYVMPMAYPSHYGKGNFGFTNPSEHPYEVIYKTLKSVQDVITNQPSVRAKIRCWLQDFNMGARYDARMVRLEKQAVYDVGGIGWVFWNANNYYTKEALDPF